MPNILPGDTAEKPKGKVHKRLVDKIAASEEAGLGSTPTSIVYAGAVAASDDKEAARWATLIARQLDLPVPPAVPKNRMGKRPPKTIVDPYTGKAVSVKRAEQLFNLGASVTTLMTQPQRRRIPGSPDPSEVAGYVNATQLLPDVSAEYALAMSMDMARVHTPIERFRGNLAVVSAWNSDSGTLSEEEALFYARWWAEHKDRPITPGDLVTLTTPELTDAIQKHREDINTNPYARLAPDTKAADSLFAAELDRLVAARDKAITNPNYLNDARRILQDVETPSWGDRATSWGAAQLNDLWHITQHVFVDVSTIPVGVVDLAQGLVPGGQTVGDAFRETQRERQYIIQRINAGDSVGHIYAEDSFLPSYAAPAFDFAVGWVFDPFIIGGKLLQSARALRMAPELLQGGTVARAITPSPVRDWFARIQYNNFGGVVLNFSRSKQSRQLFESLYESEASTFRVMDRLATHVEARSALEYQYMAIARAELLAKYPSATEKAWAEWQNIMRSHFGLAPPPGSVAERVVARHQGVSQETAKRALDATSTGEGLIVSAPKASEATIREATSPLTLRYEVPHRLLPVPGLGGGKLARLRFAESRIGNTAAGRAARSVFGVNPGAVLRPGVNAEEFFGRKAIRWREFTETERRAFQAKAAEITASGSAVERRMGALLEEMDRTAMKRIAAKMGMKPEEVKDAIDTWTMRVRHVNEQAVFGVTDTGRVTTKIATRPLTETQLIDEIVSLDPIMVRKFLKRYDSTFADLSKSMANHGLPDVAAAALRVTDTAGDMLHGAMRAWKFSVVPRPAYIGRVILLDENLRFLATTGSLMERFSSFELKKGLRGLVGKALNKPLSETIKFGDEVLEVGRAGTYGYEPLAAQAFRTEDALDDVLRKTVLHEKSLKTLGHYGVVQPADPQHLAVWERALNFQLGNSVPGRIALDSIRQGETLEGTVARLKNWAKTDGYVTLRSRVGIAAEDVDEWARELASMTHGYTMGNRELAEAAMSRSIGADMLNAVNAADRPVVHGPLVEALTGAAGSANPLKKFVNGVYNAFVRQPEDILNRQPYYRTWKRRAERAQLRAFEAKGIKPTAEMQAAIDASSRDFALSQVKKIMFDFTENTRLGEMISSVIPFFQPWLEAYQVWGHILLHRNAAMVGYVRNIWTLAEEAGVVKKDEDGRWVVPWSFWQRTASMMPWVQGDKLPEGLGLVAPLSSFNLWLSSSVEVGGIPIPAPSVAPWAGIPLKAFFAQTENPYLTSYLFNYGPDTPIVSSWVEKAVRAIKPDAFNDQRDQAVAMDFLRLYQYLGTDRDEDGKLLPPDVLRERALADARRVNAMYATIGFIAPTRGSLTFPEGYEDKEAELDQLRDTLGFEAGTDRFLAKYPELTLMTVGKTVDTRQLDGETAPRVPQSEAVQALFKQPQFARFAKRFPAWTAALVLSADDQWDDSSLGVFSDQIHSGAIKYKGLDRFLTEGQIPGFWNAVDAMYSWYNPAADRFESQGLGDDNERVLELKRRKAEELYDIYIQFPQYAKKQGIRPDPNIEGQAIWDGDAGTPPSAVVVAQARQITELEGFERFPAIQGLKAYLALRDDTAKAMEKAGISNIGDTTAGRLGLTERWETGKAEILTQFPDAEPFINAFFDDDLEGLPSRAERRLIQMQKQNPDKYQSYAKTETHLEKLADAASVQTTSDERNLAYGRQREFIDTLYESGDAWKVRLWYDSKSASMRETFLESIQVRPPAFYSRFDWELMGVKMTDWAADRLAAIDQARAEIASRSAAELRGGAEFLSGNAYEGIDAAVKRWLGEKQAKNSGFAAAIEGMQQWGWGLWRANYVDQKGKAGYAWRTIRDITIGLNEQIIRIGMHGPDSFDPDNWKEGYVKARDALSDRIEEFRKWSPVFDDQVTDIQRTMLRGDPFVEWLMPDAYYPIGITGDD